MKTQQSEWRDKLKILLNNWVIRIIKFGQAKIPEHGLYGFECPDAEFFIESLLSHQRTEICERLEKMKRAHKLINDYGENIPRSREDTIYDYTLFDAIEEIRRMK